MEAFVLCVQWMGCVGHLYYVNSGYDVEGICTVCTVDGMWRAFVLCV